MAAEAQLIDRAQGVIDGFVIRPFKTLPTRRPVQVPVSRVLHVLVNFPAVEQLLDVEKEDVHDDLERKDHEAEEQVNK